jgi:hypothetical protein
MAGFHFAHVAGFDRPPTVLVPAQFLFVRHQVMDRVVARLADLDPLAHPPGSVPLLEPLVPVQGPGDEVVEVVGLFALAELAEHARPVMVWRVA